MITIYGDVGPIGTSSLGRVRARTWTGAALELCRLLLFALAFITFAGLAAGAAGGFGLLSYTIIVGVGCAVRYAWAPRGHDPATEVAAGQVLGVPEDQLARLFPAGTAFRRGAVDRVTQLVCDARLRFGRLSQTPADRMVVERWMGDRLSELSKSERGGAARTTDVRALRRCIPYALELFFVPDYDDVNAAHMVKHSLVVRALKSGWEETQR